MASTQRLTTRRGALGRILAIAAGAAGLGAVTESKAQAHAAPHVDAKPLGASLTLHVPNPRQTHVGVDPRAVLPYGAVVDAKGHEIGTFHTASFDSTGGPMTMQTFALTDGTIVGIGSSDTFIVVGGTGKYAGAAGSYVNRPASRSSGWQFIFTFREGSHGD